MTKKEMMKAISDTVGPQEAVRLVAEAHNTEILSNRISRMETDPARIRRTEKRDLLEQALLRVMQIVELL
jgi:hypothetical protein